MAWYCSEIFFLNCSLSWVVAASYWPKILFWIMTAVVNGARTVFLTFLKIIHFWLENSGWNQKNEFLDDFCFIWHPTLSQEYKSNGMKWFEGPLIQCARDPPILGIFFCLKKNTLEEGIVLFTNETFTNTRRTTWSKKVKNYIYFYLGLMYICQFEQQFWQMVIIGQKYQIWFLRFRSKRLVSWKLHCTWFVWKWAVNICSVSQDLTLLIS